MPELPEVETVRRGLEHKIDRKTIGTVDIKVPKMVKMGSEAFEQTVRNQSFQRIGRRGKYLLLFLNRQVIISHLRMEGKYLLFTDSVPPDKHFHLFFKLDDGSTLVYQDVRKFGTFDLVDIGQEVSFFEKKKIGPEPTKEAFLLDFFEKGLAQSRKTIKTLLLDQHLVVGLGNIYVDEVLWAAKIHPQRLANQLKHEESQLLHDKIISILQLGIDKGGSTIRTYHNALGEDGKMQEYLKVY